MDKEHIWNLRTVDREEKNIQLNEQEENEKKNSCLGVYFGDKWSFWNRSVIFKGLVVEQ